MKKTKLIFAGIIIMMSQIGINAQTIDLSTYVRIGRYDLPEPTRTTAPPNSLLAQEVSAVTYNWDTQTLFVVGDGGTSIVQVSKTGQLINSMTLATGSSPQGTEFYDPEGLTYAGNGKFVLVEERDRQAVQFTYVAGTTLVRSATQTVKLGTTIGNIGLEGLCYDPMTGGFIFAKETQPSGIFQSGIDFAAGTATNGSPTTVNSTNLFNPALVNLLDFADVFAVSTISSLIGQPNYGNLLVLSQESGKVINIDRSGTTFSSLTIVSDPGNPLSIPDQQHEGLTMDSDGVLYIVSENGGGDVNHPQLWVYAAAAPDTQTPTAPTNLLAAGTTATGTNLSWTASSDNVSVTGYDVYNGSILITTVSTTSYVVNGLTPATAYTFSVKAKDAAGNVSPASNVVNVTTLTNSDTQAPTAPANLTASGTTATSTSLSWTASTDNVAVTGYDVYNGSTLITTVATTSYAVTGLIASTAYTFTVKAKDAAGNISLASNTANVTTLAESTAQIRITEYMYQGANGEFVEFTNVGTVPVDMTGWSEDDSNRHSGTNSLSAFGIVQPGESVIFTETPIATFRAAWNLCPAMKIIGPYTTDNLGRSDEINLYNASNVLVDRLTYNDQALGGPRTQGISAWVQAAAIGANNSALWTLSATGDVEGSFASTGGDIGSPGKSTKGIVSATITAGGPTTFCAGGSVTLSAPNAGSYAWSTGATSQAITVTTSGTYSVTVTTGCRTATNTITVTVNPLPIVIVEMTASDICPNDSATLTAPAGMASYLWSTGATTRSIVVRGTGNYSVTITNAAGCSATSKTIETINAMPEDLTGDGKVTSVDLGRLLLKFSKSCTCKEDINGDGLVSSVDLAHLLLRFGITCH